MVAGVEWSNKYSGLRVEHEQYCEPPDGMTRALANDYAKKFKIVNDPDGEKVLEILSDGSKLPRVTKFYSIIKEHDDCSNTKETCTEVRNAGYAIPERYCKTFLNCCKDCRINYWSKHKNTHNLYELKVCPELEGGVSGSLTKLLHNKIIWDDKNEEVAKIFTISKENYEGIQKYDTEEAKRFEALNPGNEDSAYTDGAQLQFYLQDTALFAEAGFKYLVNEIQDRLCVITGRHDYKVWNCVVLNTNKYGLRQQLHTDWYIEDKDKKMIVMKRRQRKEKRRNIFFGGYR